MSSGSSGVSIRHRRPVILLLTNIAKRCNIHNILRTCLLYDIRCVVHGMHKQIEALKTLYERLVPPSTTPSTTPSFNPQDAGISPLTFLNCDPSGNMTPRSVKIRLEDVKRLISDNVGLPAVLVGVEIPPDFRTATTVDNIDPPPESWGEDKALVMMLGNEGSGMTEKQLSCCDEFLYVNQFSADTASFNVAVAWAIVAERVWTAVKST